MRDGDLVAVRSTHGGFARLVQMVTRSPYSHCAVALWLDGGLWVAEMDGAKNVLVPLSQYAHTPFDVFRCPVDRETVRQAVLESLRGRITYDWADIAYLGLNRVLGLPLPIADDSGLVCSSYAAVAYLQAGWKPAELPAICTPGEVAAALGGHPILKCDP